MRGHKCGGIHGADDGPDEAVPGQPAGANKSAAASVQRAPALAPIGIGAGIHHADGCGVEQLQGGEVTAW